MLNDKLPPMSSLVPVLILVTILTIGISAWLLIFMGRLLKQPDKRFPELYEKKAEDGEGNIPE